jgi:6-phosphogluconate dehydrogenase
VKLLPQPRLVMLYIPAGKAVDDTLDKLTGLLAAGDIVADGGNSYWGDSIRRHQRLHEAKLHFLDVGTSGGPHGARDGACFMIGGEDEPAALIEPLLRKLAVEGGYIHAGKPGAGHFTKLVHNGIEFGMLQAIGEGVDLLTHYRDDLPVADILKCWEHGSVIRSWLVQLMEKAYREQKLDAVPSYVDDTGEVNWLVDDALHMEVPIPVITQSVLQLVASRDRGHNAARAVSMRRHGFGGHAFGPSKSAANERHHGRVGGFLRATNGAAS